MAWSLEIHHIDLVTSGDSTLIIARDTTVPLVRSVLIDGGRQNAWSVVNTYVTAQLGAGNKLNAMVCSHYDADHMGGLTKLLLTSGTYDQVFVYDQGWPGGTGQDNTFTDYVRAIYGSKGGSSKQSATLSTINRTRVTALVMADGSKITDVAAVAKLAIPTGGLGEINQRPQWLLTPAAPADPLWNGFGGAIPAGAPTMRFIAANGYVRRWNGGVNGPYTGLGTDPKNAKSLAVEVTFGNFRYYAGGDIETDGEIALEPLLNIDGNVAGRVLVMKASHHGAKTATSRDFVSALLPEAAVISCGTGNQYDHPSIETINVLDGYEAVAGSPPGPPPPAPYIPVANYLTGYQEIPVPPGNPLSYGGTMSSTAGDPMSSPVIPGHVVVTVTNAQSNAPVTGQLYRAIVTATKAALTATLAGALVPAAADPIADAVAEAAFANGPGPAAAAVIAGAGGPATAQTAVKNAANGIIPGDNVAGMAAVVTQAALANVPPVPAAIAAGAGAAAGAYYGGGANADIQGAVLSALLTAGLTAPAADPIALAASTLPDAPGLFSVRYYERNGGAGLLTETHV